MTKMYKLVRPRMQGVPCQILNGKVQGDLIKNNMVREVLRDIPQFSGELVVGSPQAPDCYEKTLDQVGHEDGFPLFVFWVCDLRTTQNLGLRSRLGIADSMMGAMGHNVQFVEHTLVEDNKALDDYFNMVVGEKGFSGVVLREVEGTYGAWDEEITALGAIPSTVYRHDARVHGAHRS